MDVIFANEDASSKSFNANENFFIIEPLSKDGLNLEKDYFLEVNVIILLSLLLLLFVAVILAIVFRLSATKKREKKIKEEIFITTNDKNKTFKKHQQKRIDYQSLPSKTFKDATAKPKYLTSGNIYQNSEYVDQNKNQKQKVSRQWNQENIQYDSFRDYNEYSSDDYYNDQFASWEPNQTNQQQSSFESFEQTEQGFSGKASPVSDQQSYYEDDAYNPQTIIKKDVYTLDEFDEWEDFN